MADMIARQPRNTTLRLAAWAAFVAGLSTLALTTTFVLLPETKAAMNVCGGRTPSLVRFQLALSVADVEEALGPTGSCRDAAIVAMDSVNRLDVPAYIATYGAFLLLSLLVVMSEAGLRRLWLAALIVLVALLADVAETTSQLAITRAIAGDTGSAQAYMPVLIIAARLKFVGIAVAAMVASWAGWKAKPRRWVLAVSCLPVMFLLPLTLAAPKSFADLAPLGTAVAWLVLLGTVLRVALRRSE